MRHKDELYCKLDLVKQAVVDIEEYIEIIEEVQIYLESSSRLNNPINLMYLLAEKEGKYRKENITPNSLIKISDVAYILSKHI